MRSIFRICCLFLLLMRGFAAAQEARSESESRLPKGHSPKVCVGYSPTSGFWGWRWMRDIRKEALCDPGYAVYEIDNPSDVRPNWFNCCPLPAADILGNSHVWAKNSCPEGFVVTGVGKGEGEYYTRELRCSNINSQRYELSDRVEGLPWGMGTSATFRMEFHKLRKTEIPESIASSFGRINMGEWDLNGCTGSPPGSLLVSVAAGACSRSRFQELRFKGVDSDPPEGYPVLMFPYCQRISDPFDPLAGCNKNLLPENLLRKFPYGEAPKVADR